MSTDIRRAEIQATPTIDGANVDFSVFFLPPHFLSFLSSLLPSFSPFPPSSPTRVQGKVAGEVVDVDGVGFVPVGEFGPNKLQRLHLQGRGGEGKEGAPESAVLTGQAQVRRGHEGSGGSDRGSEPSRKLGSNPKDSFVPPSLPACLPAVFPPSPPTWCLKRLPLPLVDSTWNMLVLSRTKQNLYAGWVRRPSST